MNETVEIQPDFLEVVQFAIKKHGDQKYGNKPYSYHLSQVHHIAIQYSRVLQVKDWPKVSALCWLHDILEDTDTTSEELRSLVGHDIYLMVEALTRQREVIPGAYFEYLGKYRLATYVKLCDRISNTQEALKDWKLDLVKRYAEEWPDLKEQAEKYNFEILVNQLDKLLT